MAACYPLLTAWLPATHCLQHDCLLPTAHGMAASSSGVHLLVKHEVLLTALGDAVRVRDSLLEATL